MRRALSRMEHSSPSDAGWFPGEHYLQLPRLWTSGSFGNRDTRRLLAVGKCPDSLSTGKGLSSDVRRNASDMKTKPY